MSYGEPEYDPLLDAWKCEICGRFVRNMGGHLNMSHEKLPISQYKEMFGLKQSFSLSSKEFSARHRAWHAKNKDHMKTLEKVRGKTTFKKGNQMRTGKKLSLQSLKAWKQPKQPDHTPITLKEKDEGLHDDELLRSVLVDDERQGTED